MTLLPVADVLIIERKRCAKCGSTFEAPSPFRYRLYKSPINEPDKTEIRKLRLEPESRDAQSDLIPLERRTTYYLDIAMDQCQHCWGENTPHATASAIRPLPPVTSLNGLQLALVEASEKRKFSREKEKKPPRSAFTLDDLTKGLGL